MTGPTTHGDGVHSYWGNSNDLDIYHDGSNSFIQDRGTGDLYIDAATNFFVRNQGNGDVWIKATDAGVSLRYQDTQKLITTNTGVTVNGSMVASGDVYAEDNIYLTDAGTVRGKIQLNSSDRDNLDIKAVSLGSTMNFFTADTLALGLDASQNAIFAGTVQIGTNVAATSELLQVQAFSHNEAFSGKSSASNYLWFLRNENSSGRFQLFNSSGSQTIEFTGADGAATFAGQVNGITPTSAANLTRKDYVDSAISGVPQGTVTKSGTPVNNQLAVWTSATNIEGESELTYDGATFRVGGTANTSTFLDVVGTNTAGAPARAAAVRIYGYEGRGEGIFYYDTEYADDEWYSGIPYSGGSSYQIGFDTSGGQAEYVANSVLRIASTGQITFNNYGQSTFSGTVTTFPAFAGDGQIVDRTPTQVLSDIGAAPATGGAYLPLAGGTMTGVTQFNDHTQHGDQVSAKFGAGNDLEIFHNGSNSHIQNATGDLYVENLADNKDIIFRSDNGSGGFTTYLTIDGLNENITFSKYASFLDGVRARFGNSSDLQIFHDGSNSYINDTGSGDLILTSNANSVQINKSTGVSLAKFIVDGSVELYNNSTKKFETTSTGVTILDTCLTNEQFLVKNATGARYSVAGDTDTGLGEFDGSNGCSLVSKGAKQITVKEGAVKFDPYTSTSTQSGASGSLSPIQNNQAPTIDSLAQLAVDPSGNVVRSHQSSPSSKYGREDKVVGIEVF